MRLKTTRACPGAALQDFMIQNMVGSCDVQFPVRLEGLAYAHSKFANVRRTLPLAPARLLLCCRRRRCRRPAAAAERRRRGRC